MLSFNAMIWTYRCSFSSTWRSKESSATANTEGGQRYLRLYAIHLETDQETRVATLSKTSPLWSQLAFPTEPLTGQDSASDVINLDRNSFDQFISPYTSQVYNCMQHACLHFSVSHTMPYNFWHFCGHAVLIIVPRLLLMTEERSISNMLLQGMICPQILREYIQQL